MLSFFRSFAPYQYISLLVVLLLLRLPLLVKPFPLLVPELNWMLVGEQMRYGHTLYRDIWDNLSPLSAGVYWLIDLAVGRSQVAYWAVATVISVGQLVYFNYIMNVREIFPERTFWPGLFYTLFLNLSFDCTTLSPMLLSTTFLLLAFGTIVRQLTQRQGATDEVFEVGVYVGIAALFYLPSALFIVWASLSLLLFTGATVRQHSLTIFGFAFPILLVVLYYYFTNSLDAFNRNLLTSVFQVRQYDLSDLKTLALSLLVPLTVGVLGVLSLFNSASRFVNFQQRCQQIMLLWAFTALLTIPLMPFLAPMLFISFVPPMAFFAVLYFASIRRIWLRELMFLGVLVFMAGVLYQGALALFPTDVGQLTNLRVKPSGLPESVRNRSLLVIGDDISAYRYNRPATPYLNWDLAKYDLRNLDNYEAVIQVYDHFRQDPPDYIVDRQQVVPKLFARVPALAAQYRPTTTTGLYERIRPSRQANN